jgi:hypothetical protein
MTACLVGSSTASRRRSTHGQDHVGVFTASEETAENVVSDAPDEGNNFVVGGLIHYDGVARSDLE